MDYDFVSEGILWNTLGKLTSKVRVPLHGSYENGFLDHSFSLDIDFSAGTLHTESH
jgi:hypothetical protein